MGDALGVLDRSRINWLKSKRSHSTVGDFQGEIILRPGDVFDSAVIDRLHHLGVLADVYGAEVFAQARDIAVKPFGNVVILTPEQRKIAVGKRSATQIISKDNKIILHEGEIISDDILNELEAENLVDMLRLEPEGMSLSQIIPK
ncbi:MAG TPA: hypothetical protein PLZ21_05370 [Armatimonadota bacterium]|nr:hypothetical protein [Armatimonadota bacterium]